MCPVLHFLLLVISFHYPVLFSFHTVQCPVLSEVSCIVLSWFLLLHPALSLFCTLSKYCPVQFCFILSCPVLPCSALSYPVLFLLVLSFPVQSCSITSCCIDSILSCFVLSCYFLSFPIQSYASHDLFILIPILPRLLSLILTFFGVS